MQVFKLCMHIIKKNLPVLSIYVFVYLAVSLVMSANTTAEQKKITSFSSSKSNIAFISAEDTPLIEGLKDELGNIANFIELPDRKEDLQDALFFRSVSYILRIPAGFTEKFMKGEEASLEKTAVPDSFSNTYIDLCIDKYFNMAKLYVTSLNGITQEELVGYLKKDLSMNASVELKTNGEKNDNHGYIHYFFNYFSYALLSVIILGMSTMIIIFNNRDLKMRNGCSPVSSLKMNMQFVLANLAYTFSAWAIMVLLCLAVNYKNFFNMNTAYFVINSFIFAFCCASISYLIGNLAKHDGHASAACNVVALGLSFISGAFVPQELLGEYVLKIASFTPAYWFVKANNTIAGLTQFDFSHVKPVLSDMLIIICFGVAFFSVGLVIGKKRRFS